MFTKKAVTIAAATISAITVTGFAQSASASLTPNVTTDLTGGNQGMFSPIHGRGGVTTVTFNDILLQNQTVTGTPEERAKIQASNTENQAYRRTGFGVTRSGSVVSQGDAQAIIRYTFEGEGNNIIRNTSQEGVLNGEQLNWAPAGANDDGQIVKNTSNYLNVANNKSATIKSTTGSLFDSFGLNWGAAHEGNTVTFKRAGNIISTFTYNYHESKLNQLNEFSKQLNNGGLLATWQTTGGYNNGQYNAFVTFNATDSEQFFDEIVLTQALGQRFESDNHTFRTANEFQRTVPEPGLALGLLAVGGVFIRQRRGKKSEASDA